MAILRQIWYDSFNGEFSHFYFGGQRYVYFTIGISEKRYFMRNHAI